MKTKVVIRAGDERSDNIDLSWEGQAELEQQGHLEAVGGRFLNMDIGTLNGIAHRTDVNLQIEGRRYNLTSVERSGAFEAVENWL